MSLWLTIFIVSGSGIFILLVLKLVQEKFSILLFWPEIRHHAEVVLVKHKKKTIHYRNYISVKNLYIILHFFVLSLKKMSALTHEWLDKRSYGLLKLIRGKHTLDARGKSSYFLHDIASFKDRFRK